MSRPASLARRCMKSSRTAPVVLPGNLVAVSVDLCGVVPGRSAQVAPEGKWEALHRWRD